MTIKEKARIDEQGLKWNRLVTLLLKELNALQRKTESTYITGVTTTLEIYHVPNLDVCKWPEKKEFDAPSSHPPVFGELDNPFKRRTSDA